MFVFPGENLLHNLNIKGLFAIALGLLIPGLCFAEGAYIQAYGKGYAQYTAWLAEAERDGRHPTAEERRAKHKESFAEAQRAYSADYDRMQGEFKRIGREMVSELLGFNPPAPVLSESQKKSALEKLKNPQNRGIASSGTPAMADARQSVVAPAPTQAAPPPPPPPVETSHAPPPTPQGGQGGGQAVSFGEAPANQVVQSLDAPSPNQPVVNLGAPTQPAGGFNAPASGK